MTFATGVRGAAVGVSLAAHAALIVATAPAESPRPLPPDTAVSSQMVEFTNVTRTGDEAAVTPTDVAPAPTVHRAPMSSREPRAKVAPAPAVLAAKTVEPTNAVAPVISTTPASPAVAHFTLAPSSQWSASAAAPLHTPVQAPPLDRDVVAERDVSTRAKLLSAAEVPYPPEARAAEIEADVPVDIIVDANGAVAQARGITRAGYGLDDAALRAISRYRFEPATRDGRRVAVRMRWRVSFRLR